MLSVARIAQGLVVVAALLMGAAAARAADVWTVVQAIGDVQIAPPGATAIDARDAMPVPDGSTVSTGQTGRAVLLRGRETIVMSPSSIVTLPSGPNRDMSKVRQRTGTLLFKIGKKPEAHFEVDTPYLAAVVKGTTFTVKVSTAGATVHVLEGAVEVATTNRENVFLTRAGQISSVFAKAANEIFTTGAALLNGQNGSGDAWGPSQSRFELESPGQGAQYGDSGPRFVGNTGLRASNHAADDRSEDQELTTRAPERFLSAFRAVNDTMSAARVQTLSAKPVNAGLQTKKAADEAAKQSSAKKQPKTSGTAQKRYAENGPAARQVTRVWTVTQTRGTITIDATAFDAFGEGRVRTLPLGTKVETGANARIGVAAQTSEFVIEANSVVILGDPSIGEAPQVISGKAERYEHQATRDADAPNASSERRTDEDQTGSAGRWDVSSNAGANARPSANGAVPTPFAQTPKNSQVFAPSSGHKTQEVRSKVLGGLTLALYSLTAVLVLAFGARWMWNRYRAKANVPPAETLVQARVRSIKEA